ncbi:OprD family outer membrane porin [Hydrogenimonas sp. SS33]|uniref:OprD family outer membrane porin n=1 Tax=Hydrogenimonas leucolamina TaxID=2954236 RepID=UPI00336BF03E
MRKTVAFLLLGLIFLPAALPAADTSKVPKRILKANRTLIYKMLPPEVETLDDFLTKGVFYGRLRMNTFRWDWKEETPVTRDNWAAGLGASLTYKSPCWYGFGFTLDGYTSQNPRHMDREDIPFLKAGKDALSRHDVFANGDYQMNVMAQAYAEYRLSKTRIRWGRQKFESFLTKSNDTKMIPNTFQGVSLVSKDLPKHIFKLAWFSRQKLRDHTRFHDVLTFADGPLDGLERTEKLVAVWSNNDDSGMHRGLSWSNYEKAGESTRHDLLVAEVWSMAAPHLKAMVNYTAVPNVLSSATGEAYYTFSLSDYIVVPGVRYMHQFDNGGGAIGGASLTGLLASGGEDGGYNDPDSLEGWLAAARIDVKRKEAPWRVRLAYSRVGDEADIVAPWRGFPTGGYTRAMGQYNWFANTKTWLLRGDYDMTKAGLVPGLSLMAQVAVEDYDQDKSVIKSGNTVYLQPSDRTVLHLDAIERFPKWPGLEARLRMAFVDADRVSGRDPSYNEYRFELNYLF